MLPAFLANSPENGNANLDLGWEMPKSKKQFGPYFGGFDQMMADFRSICQMEGNGENVSSHREELMGQMRENPYFGAICSVLEEEKQKIGQMTICLANSVKLLFGQNGRINNNEEGESEVEQMSTVEQKMKECREFCNQQSGGNEDPEVEKVKAKMRECLEEQKRVKKLIEKNVAFCMEHSLELLNLHAQLRPITPIDIQHFISGIRLSAQLWTEELRDAVCSQLLLLKSFGANERKKRQNFSSSTISVLNKYFMEHLNQPYPDEATKMALAEQCGITMAQVLGIFNFILGPLKVSNWFGNKRIRFRKAQQLKGQNGGEEEGDEMGSGKKRKMEKMTTMNVNMMVKDEPEGDEE